MTRILCLGNRLVPADTAGPRVYDALAGRELGPGVELCEGGTAGLALLPAFEGVEQVVVVDAVEGFGQPGEVLVLAGDELAGLATRLDHGLGLPELLRLLPLVCEGRPPRVQVVGLEAPADPQAVRTAAERARRLARESADAMV